MTTPWYAVTGNPATGAAGSSAPIRAEFTAIAAAFALLPQTLTANKAVVVNAGGTGLTITTGSLALAGDLTTTGAFNTTLVQGAAVSLTLPLVSGTLATLAGTETLSNKTFVAPALGTPVSGVATNLTGTAAGLTAGTVTTNANLTGGVTSVGNAATVVTNANLTGVITSVGNATSIASQTGTGTKFVVDNGPTLIAPVLGAATATSLNGLIVTTTTGTLTLTNGKTLAVAKSLTLDGTDSTTMTFPTTSATIARTDAANTFTGAQTFNTPIAAGSVATMTATVGGGVPTPPNNTTTFLRGDGTFAAPANNGTVTSVSVVTANGVSGSVASSTTTPAITLTLGAITPTTVNGNTFTTGTYTLTGTAGKTLTFAKSLTLDGTDSTTMTFPTTSATVARTDAGQTFTGTQAFGAITYTTLNGNTWATGTGTLSIAASKTLTASNTLTLAGTDSTTMTFPTTSATVARTDAANTFTGHQTIEGVTSTGATGTGKFVFDGSPTLTTAVLGSSTATTQAVGDNSTKLATTGYADVTRVAGSRITNSLSGDVALNNTGTYFDGPSVAQGSTGTWFASGTVTLRDTNVGSAQMNVKLWDGTTLIASAAAMSPSNTNNPITVSLSGYISAPAGNIRISVNDATATTGLILFNYSGNSLDSTLSAKRIA